MLSILYRRFAKELSQADSLQGGDGWANIRFSNLSQSEQHRLRDQMSSVSCLALQLRRRLLPTQSACR